MTLGTDPTASGAPRARREGDVPAGLGEQPVEDGAEDLAELLDLLAAEPVEQVLAHGAHVPGRRRLEHLAALLGEGGQGAAAVVGALVKEFFGLERLVLQQLAVG